MSHSYEGTWRGVARPIIEEVIRENRGESEKVIRALLRDAYPFGPRKHHPYKIWCDEINVQLGKKKAPKTQKLIDEGQQTLL